MSIFTIANNMFTSFCNHMYQQADNRYLIYISFISRFTLLPHPHPLFCYCNKAPELKLLKVMVYLAANPGGFIGF